jgi:hypothetical protein
MKEGVEDNGGGGGKGKGVVEDIEGIRGGREGRVGVEERNHQGKEKRRASWQQYIPTSCVTCSVRLVIVFGPYRGSSAKSNSIATD